MAVTRASIVSLSLLALATPAAAQAVAETPDFAFPADPSRTLVFSIFLGAQVNPAYFGSDEMTFGPSVRASLAQLNFGALRFNADGDEPEPYERRQGFGYGVSARYIDGRDSSEYDEIRGLDDIDPTFEVGGAIGYAWPNFEAVADLRYGFGGSEALVGELRAFYVARPTDRLTLRIGPRLLYGSDQYVDTYFGISERESDRSGLDRYEPGGGLVSAGAEVIATYKLADRWWLEGAVKWQHFTGDAGDSPIVKNGASDFTEVRLGVRRAFALRF